MAFTAAPGWGNLPQGNWSPVIYSKKVLKFFKKASVVEEITNTEFEGEINQQGDTVTIIKQPEVTVVSYARGLELTPQDLDDDDITMTIDQANAYLFRLDDIEKKQSHVAWDKMATDASAYKLKDTFDTDVLTVMTANGTTTAGTGVAATEVSIGFDAADTFTPLNIANRLARLMDENNVPEDGGRFFAAAPIFFEYLGQEDSKYIEANTMGDTESFIRQRKIGSKDVQGMKMFKSNNIPLNSSSNYQILAGHVGATATAKNILISEVIRSERFFGDLYRGLMVHGRKVLREEALFTANVTFS